VARCSSSTIWECVHRLEGTRHCVKVWDLRRLNSTEWEAAEREVLLHKRAPPRGSVQVSQVLQDVNHLYMIVNLVANGNLASKLHCEDFMDRYYQHVHQRRPRMTESQVQQLARSLLEAVQQLHDVQIVHLDLQPSNLLLDENEDVILCDFGNAIDLKQQDFHMSSSSNRRKLKNLAYSAPERILGKSPTCANDMWSVGIILFLCLSGRVPFEEDRKRAMKHCILQGEYDFSSPEWTFVSRGAKQFISSLLHVDPGVRMTVVEALSHPWLSTPPLVTKQPAGRRKSAAKRLWGRLRRPPRQPERNGTASVSSSSSSFGSARGSRHG